MKLVWVNQFNADGSVKPMSEWQLRTTKHEDKFYFKDKYSDFDGFLEADCKHKARDCSGLNFARMKVMKRYDTHNGVKCTEYEQTATSAGG